LERVVVNIVVVAGRMIRLGDWKNLPIGVWSLDAFLMLMLRLLALALEEFLVAAAATIILDAAHYYSELGYSHTIDPRFLLLLASKYTSNLHIKSKESFWLVDDYKHRYCDERNAIE
jgi:hypothetical protein